MSEEFPIPLGRYELVERLAVGGMAELFLARLCDRSSDETFVIKRLLPHMAGDAQFNAMFVDEAKLTARLAHPKIARTYALGRHGSQLFIVMQHVDGIDVLALLRECAHRRVRMPPELAVYIAREVLDALHFAHTQVDDHGQPLGVVHRDVSPSNVLLSRAGDVVLVDFGIARATVHHHRTRAGSLKGKYGYMSPEQVVDGEMDARSDVFSAAIVLAEMLTGRRLFAAPNELDVLLMVRDADLDRFDRFGSNVPADLARICRGALRKHPGDRPTSAAELRDQLTLWLAQNGHEVGRAQIARIVDSLYEDAWRRKRKTVETQAADLAKREPAAPLAPLEVDGIPLGTERSAESAPVVSPVVSIDLDESVRVEDILHEDGAASDAAVPAPLEDEDQAATRRWERPEEDADELLAAAGVAAGGEASAGGRVAGGETAIASVLAAAPRSPDPAALDFDGTEVSGRPGSGRWATRHAEERDQGGPAAGAPPAVDATPDDRGNFAATSAIRVIYRLAVAHATGLLVAVVGGIRKEIYFRDGTPEYVTSNVAAERLGEYLTKRGVLSEGELAMALAMMPHYGGKLGDTLVGLGLMRPLDVFRELTSQVRDKLVDVCTWSRGEFSWYAGVENTRDAFPLDLDSFEVLGAGAMALQPGYLFDWLRSVERARPRAVRDGAVTPDVFQLGEFMQQIYDQLDGEHTVRALYQGYTDTEERGLFIRMLYLLCETELAGVAPGEEL